MNLLDDIAVRHRELTALRRDIHRHPELAYEEVRTANIVAEQLESYGIEVHQGLGKTGVVGTLRNGGGNRAIALRADMDALAMDELNTFDHKSAHEGKMHGCGHDGHTVMLLGAAKYLADNPVFDGTVHFVFQPAEEGGCGGEAMIKDGLFDKFQMRSIWGMHNWPGMDVGKVGVHDGACMAAADMFEIQLTGIGGHAAMPDMGIDPIPCGAALVQSLQTIVSRRVPPLQPAVVSVTIFEAGSALNVIPDTVRLGGTARSFSPEIRRLLQIAIQDVAENTAKAYGCKISFEWEPGYPPTINHAESAARATAIASHIVGADNIIANPEPSMGAEDFAFMLAEKPGAYIWLGAGPAKEGAMLHNANYDFNDEVLATGASYWAQLVESELPK